MISRRLRCYQHAAQAWDTWISTPVWRFSKRRRAWLNNRILLTAEDRTLP